MGVALLSIYAQKCMSVTENDLLKVEFFFRIKTKDLIIHSFLISSGPKIDENLDLLNKTR